MTKLIDGVDVVDVRGDLTAVEVSSVEFDSRQVQPGSLFCCIPGDQTDGHLYAGRAVAGGAVSLLCERFVDLDVSQVRVPQGSVRPAMARVASTFNGDPSQSMTMVGVTGTNGKTTVTQLVRSILVQAGTPTGVVGTLDGARTTPEAPVLQGQLAALRADGTRAVAMEVSSHGLDQHRVDGILFDVAAFTNLSRDHLDHHRTMEAYFETKASLFLPTQSRLAVVNVDDRWGQLLADRIDAERLITVRGSDASDVVLSVGSSSFRWRGIPMTIPLSGRFNVDNALMAATITSALGVDIEDIGTGLSSVSPIPGRMEVVSGTSQTAVLVDFAHTPAGLDAALSAARDLAGHGRVICLFGCGGDRDQGKRSEMGEAAARWADAIVLTSDNPRSEDPLAIIDQIKSGIDGAVELTVEPDRRRAIETAVGLGEPGDVVVIAGKGHETNQVQGDRVVPFDDRLEAKQALAYVGRSGNPNAGDEQP